MATDHRHFMQKALDMAQRALDRDEFPVGCVAVYKGRVIAQGARTGSRQTIPGELDHAEIIALRRMEGLANPVERRQVTLYVTMEPCLMCFGALLISGIGTIVYAFEDPMGGGTACDRTRLPVLYRDNAVRIVAGICRDRSLAMFKTFFANPVNNYWRDSPLAAYTLEQT